MTIIEKDIVAAAIKAAKAVGIERIRSEEFFGMNQRKQKRLV